MPASRLKRDQVTVRRTELLRLRRMGVRYDDDRIIDLGYASDDAARRDLHRALEQHRDEERAEASIYRQQENERLDALLEAAWPRATTPTPVLDKEGEVIDHVLDMRAVDTVLRLMDRRAKLNGLDMPVKTELSGPGGGLIPVGPVALNELRALINTAGEPDPEDDDVQDADGEDADDDGNEA